MRLATSARRFDVSPAWLPWVGTAAALELFAEVAAEDVRDHDIGLANALRAAVGSEPADRPVVTLPDPDGSVLRRLSAAGCRAAGRAGRVRLGFHLWNDVSDVDRAATALLSAAP
jgi:selenocysteine lyase/cysteine desulfurase